MDEKHSKDLEPLVQQALVSKRLPTAAIWFAAPKAGTGFQRYLCNVARALRNGEPGKFPEERRLLFARLTFVEHASDSVMKPTERLDLLRTDYNVIFQNGFATYYFVIAARILDKVTDIDTLRACMLALRGCERVHISLAERLAERAVERMHELCKDPSDLADEVLKYLDEGIKDAVNEYRARSERTTLSHDPSKIEDMMGAQRRKIGRVRWRREFFREWVLQAYCRLLVYDMGPAGAFDFLVDCNWFNTPPIRRPVAVEMSREADIAIGSYFHTRPHLFERSAGRGAEFIQLIRKLSQSERYKDRESASYLIRHTRPTFGEYGVKVHHVFHPYLAKLANDRRLRANLNFRALYETNLGRLGSPRRKRH
jgi:hypothetical protein